MQPANPWSNVRGFNYQPGYSAHLQYTWTNFDAACWKREVPWALRFGTNALRVWLDWTAYLAIGDRMFDVLDQAMDILDGNGMRIVPVLFNRWVDRLYPVGGISDNDLRVSKGTFEKFHPYIDGLGKRFGADKRVLLWDICNTPLSTVWNAHDILLREHAWLSTMAARLRQHTGTPLTIGAMEYDYMAQTAALCDVIGFLPYPAKIGEMEKMCVDHKAVAAQFKKPLICLETCVGSFDDHERGALAKDCIETLERHGIGWFAWMLCEGKFITGSRERPDSNSIRPDEGYLAFVLKDGSTRPGHEWLEQRTAVHQKRTTNNE